MLARPLLVLLAALAAPMTSAQTTAPGSVAPLPPALPWSGASERLIVEADDPWITPAERDGFALTPSYAETRAYVERLVAASPLLSLESFGTTPEGRDLYVVRASHGGAAKPVVLIQAAIHPGEIDGKDAGLMLLRDIGLRGKADLLDRIDLAFVPIYNPDGHERTSAFNRPNLRGPANPGIGTTAQGINLNRDYAKADAPETRAMLHLIRRLDPVLYLDMHVSDGFDHGYDVTYTYAGWGRYVQSEAITRWLNGAFEGGVNAFIRAMGHNPHFYPSAIDDQDLSKGLRVSAEGPRYSTGYGDYTHIPTVLVEMHNLKPYRQRVLGAYAMMEGALRMAAADLDGLQQAIAADRAARPETLTVRWERDETPVETIAFTGIAFERYLSPASGAEEIRYLGRIEPWRLPVVGQRPVQSVSLPKAWWVPAAATDVIDLLDLHGVGYERTDAPRTLQLDMVRLFEAELGPVYDTRVLMSGDMHHEMRTETMPTGSLRVPYDQPRGLLAAALLEAEAPDSLLAWGFFPEMLEKTTSGMDRYIAAAMADAMLAGDPELRQEFDKKLAADPAFAADSPARLAWFVDRSPYRDERRLLYPIGREL